MSISEKIAIAIQEIKDTDICGCISGSSMTNEDFDTWTSVPDVDIFVYEKTQMIYAADLLIMKLGYKPAHKREEWKLERMRKGIDANRKGSQWKVSTLKLERDGVIANVTWKPGCDKLTNVLASFDMSIIMVGYDIEKKVGLDLRVGWDNMVDDKTKWSDSVKVAVPNPLRSQKFELYEVSMWVRQFDRVIKYWDRGFDTRPMARFYIEAITEVIDAGSLFETEASMNAYNNFVEEYGPMRDKMIAWLEDKEEC